MQVLMYKVSQQKYLTGGFTLSNILLIGLIAVSILLVFLAIAILIRLSRLSNKLKQMGINYDVTGFGVKQKEENKFALLILENLVDKIEFKEKSVLLVKNKG